MTSVKLAPAKGPLSPATPTNCRCSPRHVKFERGTQNGGVGAGASTSAGAGAGGHVPVPFTHRPLAGSTTEPQGPGAAHAVQEHVPPLHSVSMAAHQPVVALHAYPQAG